MLDIGICVLLVAPYGVLLTAPVFAKAAAGLHAGVRTCMHAHRGAFANAAAPLLSAITVTSAVQYYV